MSGDQRIEKRLAKIEKMLRPLPDKLWTQSDIAAYMQVSEATVRRLLRNDPNAPAPLSASTDENGQLLSPRYLGPRVIGWIQRMDRLGQSSRSAKASASAR